MYAIGQPVLCIADVTAGLSPYLRALLRDTGNQVPAVGTIYHIRAVAFEEFGGERCWLRLRELVNPVPPPLSEETAFGASCFRPLVARPNDGAAFVEQLRRTTAPARETEPA